MKHTVYNDIIKRCKLQHRIGQAPGPGSQSAYDLLTAAAAELERRQNSIAVELATVSDVSNRLFIPVLNRMYTETNKAATELGVYLQVMQDYKTTTDQLVDSLTYVEQRNDIVANGFKLSAESADAYAKTLRASGLASVVSDEQMMEAAVGLKDFTNGFIKSTKANTDWKNKLIEGQVYLRRNLKLTKEAAIGVEGFAKTIGMTSADLMASYDPLFDKFATSMGVDKTTLMADTLEDISKLSANVLGVFRKMPAQLTKAVIQAKTLGLSMNDVYKAGTKTLDIEESIGNEIEFQQLTGERLLTKDNKSFTEELRIATLSKDPEKQAQLIRDYFEMYGDKILDNQLLMENAMKTLNFSEDQVTTGIVNVQEQKKFETAKQGAGIVFGPEFDKIKDAIETLKNFNPGEVLGAKGASDIRNTGEKVDEEYRIKESQKIKEANIAVKTIQDAMVGYMKGESGVGKGDGFMDQVNALNGLVEAAAPVVLGKQVRDMTTKQYGSELEKFGPNDATSTFGVAVDSFKSSVEAFNKGVSITPKKKSANDFIISDNGDVIQPHEDDVIAGFKSGGVIANTLNNVSSTSTTTASPATPYVDNRDLTVPTATTDNNSGLMNMFKSTNSLLKELMSTISFNSTATNTNIKANSITSNATVSSTLKELASNSMSSNNNIVTDNTTSNNNTALNNNTTSNNNTALSNIAETINTALNNTNAISNNAALINTALNSNITETINTALNNTQLANTSTLLNELIGNTLLTNNTKTTVDANNLNNNVNSISSNTFEKLINNNNVSSDVMINKLNELIATDNTNITSNMQNSLVNRQFAVDNIIPSNNTNTGRENVELTNIIKELASTIKSTKTETLDINKLASAIATAMKSVTIQTTAIVKNDNIYSGNVMNTPPRFTV